MELPVFVHSFQLEEKVEEVVEKKEMIVPGLEVQQKKRLALFFELVVR